MERKNSKTIGILTITAVLIVLFLIFAYYFFTVKTTAVYFNPSKKTYAEKLYKEVVERDLVNDYPKSPEEVMEYNISIIRLMYGDMIADESIYEEVISRQRMLFSEELIKNNPVETQTEVIKTAVATLKEQNISAYNFTLLPTAFNPEDKTKCYIRVQQEMNNGQKFYWEYSLAKNPVSGNWQIVRWDLTDQYYNVIEEN